MPAKGETHGNWNGGPVSVLCQACGKPFSVRKSQFEKGRGKYCSKDCQYAGHFLIKSCESCGKEMRVKKSHDDRGVDRYCSLKCRSIGWIKRGTHAGENAGRYVDGKSQSPEYVRRASHDRRVQKQNNGGSYTLEEWGALCAKYDNKCLCCGRGDVLLTVDHVTPVTKGGSNDIANIQPLCKSCNSRKHNKVIDYR